MSVFRPSTWPYRWRFVAGNPECPVFFRYRVFDFRGHKVRLHHFLPDMVEDHSHDHPWDFWTLVLWGEYTDIRVRYVPGWVESGIDSDDRLVESCSYERMTQGTLRRRPALHRHRTRAGAKGCWTLVWTKPEKREWGFFGFNNTWVQWQEFLDRFGQPCPPEHEPKG